MGMIFTNFWFTLYVVLVWIYAYLATELFMSFWKRYYSRHNQEPSFIIANTSFQTTNMACGSSFLLILLLFFPPFVVYFGPPDWIDSVVVFVGAVLVHLLPFVRRNMWNTREQSQDETQT